MGSFSIWHWLVVLLIVMLVFGTRRLRDIGQDLGSAVRGFREGMRDAADEKRSGEVQTGSDSGQIIDGEVKEKTRS